MVGFSGMAVVVLATLGGAAWVVCRSKRLYRRPISFDSGDVAIAPGGGGGRCVLYALSGAAAVAVLISVVTKH